MRYFPLLLILLLLIRTKVLLKELLSRRVLSLKVLSPFLQHLDPLLIDLLRLRDQLPCLRPLLLQVLLLPLQVLDCLKHLV